MPSALRRWRRGCPPGRRAGRRPTPRRHGQDQQTHTPWSSWPSALRRWRRGCPAPAAERAADRLLDAMAKTSDSDTLKPLAECLAAVAPRLPAPAAERIAERAADRLLDAMAKTSDSDALERLAEGFAAVAPRLPGPGRRAGRRPTPRRHGQDQRLRRPGAAGRVLCGGGAAAARPGRRAGRRPTPRRHGQDQRLRRPEAAGRVLCGGGVAAARPGRRAGRRPTPRRHGQDQRLRRPEVASQWFAAVAPRLPAPAAERAADRLLDAMAKASDSDALGKLAECFAAVASRLPAPAAERIHNVITKDYGKQNPNS